MYSFIRNLKMKNLSDVCKEEQRKFLKSFDYVLSDMDGVIWTKYEVIKGAPECLNSLKAMGKRVHYVTNNSMAYSEELVAILRKNKFDARAGDVTNPQFTVIEHLKETKFQGALCALVTENFKEEMRTAGFTIANLPKHPVEESVEAIVQHLQDDLNIKGVLIGVDFNVTYMKLQKALIYLKRDDCIFLTSGTDTIIPWGSLGPLIGTDSFTHIVSSLSNREPTNVSKPSILSCAHVNNKLGIRKPNKVLFIGDYITQDMHMAAIGGYQKLLVLSGHTQLTDIHNWVHPEEWKPQYYIENLNAFYKIIRDLDLV